jgi:single-strand DNA-binding protein
MSHLNKATMNSLRNRVQLIGNLGQDPEIRKTEKGKSVAKFTLATTESYRNADGQKIEDTTWHNLVAWNGLAEVAGKYLKKGREVAVEGRIAHRAYEDKEGTQKYFTEIILSDILLLRSQKEA